MANDLKNYVVGFVDGSIYTFKDVRVGSPGVAGVSVFEVDGADDRIVLFDENTLFMSSEEAYIKHIQER